MLSSRDQQSVVCFHHDQITHADDSNEFAWSVNVVSFRVYHAHAPAGDQISRGRFALGTVMLMQGGPRSEVVPSKIRGQAENISRLFTFRRPRLKDGVVHADILTLGIELAESRRELMRAVHGGDLFEQTGGLGEMFVQRVREGAGAPQKHAAIPKI